MRPSRSARMARSARAGWACCIAALLAIGCERPAAQSNAQSPPLVAVRTADSPIASLSVFIPRASISTSEILEVVARVTSTDDAQVSRPELPSSDDMRLLETRAGPAKRRTDGAIEQTWTMVLEPDLPGSFEVPGVRVAIRNARSGEVTFLTTEPWPVRVTSVLDESTDAAVSELRVAAAPPPPAGTISEAIGAVTAGIVLAALLVIAIAATGIYFLVRRLGGRSSIPAARRAITRQIDTLRDTPASALPGVLTEAARLLRACVAERAGLDAPAMMASELTDACPELISVGETRHILESIEHLVFSGSEIDHERAASLLGATDRSLDELATFVPTRYLDQEEPVA